MRYSDKQKADVIAFVKKHNAKHGRGGQSAAKEKFGISPISIASWLSKAGEELPGKGGRKKASKASASTKKKGKPGRPKGSKNASTKGKRGRAKAKKSTAKATPAAGGGTEKKLQRLSQILAEMESLQQEFDSLKKTL